LTLVVAVLPDEDVRGVRGDGRSEVTRTAPWQGFSGGGRGCRRHKAPPYNHRKGCRHPGRREWRSDSQFPRELSLGFL